jgi:hypothetical protein
VPSVLKPFKAKTLTAKLSRVAINAHVFAAASGRASSKKREAAKGINISAIDISATQVVSVVFVIWENKAQRYTFRTDIKLLKATFSRIK